MSTNSRPGTVYLVGAGPGDPGLLTLRAAELLREADVLLYDALASDAIVAYAPPRCERIFVGKRGGNHAMPQEEIEALAVRKAREGKRVVRLKGGDPFVFGRGGEEAQTLRAAGIAFEIVPGISSAIAAPAYAGIPVTHRAHNPAFTVATGHEDPTKPESTLDWARLADPHRTLVLLMAVGNLRAIARKLVEGGLDQETPVAVIQDGTRPTQRTAVGTLATIADEVAAAGIEAPAITVVGNVVRLRDEIAWFDRGALFGKRVLITRPAHQAGAFAGELYARGVEPILASSIAIEPPDDPRPANRAVDEIARYAWLVFTSQNGVDAFFDRLASLDADARAIGATKIAAIGSKTAQRLRERGVRADLVPAEFVSEEIGRALVEAAKPGDRVLVYRAQEARDVLPAMLEEAGISVTVVAAYKTTFARDPEFAKKAARADVLTFTSASTVRGFAAALGGDAPAVEAARGKAVACIGPITAEAARECGLHVDVVADVYTTSGLLDALEAHFTLRS
jgi:uroporphyrinogen III methyltransferase / synthase